MTVEDLKDMLKDYPPDFTVKVKGFCFAVCITCDIEQKEIVICD